MVNSLVVIGRVDGAFDHQPFTYKKTLPQFVFQMAARGMGVSSLLVGMLWMASLTSCFNFEPLEAHVYRYPYFGTQGRESYFGFSVALLHNSRNNTNWWVVMIPDAYARFFTIICYERLGEMRQLSMTWTLGKIYIIS